MERICCVIGAGEMGSPVLPPKRFVICADAGLRHAQRLRIEPDLIVGDFDSLGETPQGEHVIVHPSVKNETDMLLAVQCGIERGFRSFLLFGAMGGRLDHTLGNIEVLRYLSSKGCRAKIIGVKQCAAVLTDGETFSFEPRETGFFSVFSLSDCCEGVSIRGAKYELDNYTLLPLYTRGVSNEFCGSGVEIGVKKGSLLLIWEV